MKNSTDCAAVKNDSIPHNKADCVRLDPEQRLCPAFDCTSIKLFAAPDREEMGVAVVDNCAEEHIM